MADTEEGQSPTARAFGAKIDVSRSGVGLFYVAGRTTNTPAIVRAAGGQIAVDFGNGHHLVAVLPVMAGTALGRHREIARCGPITIDPNRFQHVARLLGHPGPPTPTTR
jgi:hypothetical protein